MRTILALVTALLFAVPASADTVYGSCHIRNGESCAKSNHTISTSWNSKKGYPDSGGDYEIDLGGSVDQRIPSSASAPRDRYPDRQGYRI